MGRQKHAADNFNTEIAEKEKNISNELFKKYFRYPSPSTMYNALSDTKITERNKIQVGLIKSDLTNLKRDTGNTPKGEMDKIKENIEVLDIAELILYFNGENQKGGSLKMLTPNQMLSRLPISLA